MTAEVMQAPALRVLQFVNTLEFGGATDYALTLCEHLDDERFESHFAHGPGSGWEVRAAACAVEVLDLDTMKPTHTADSDNSVLGDLVALVRLVRYLRDQRIDVIHTHGSKSRLIGGLAGLIARVPLRVQSAHGFAFNSRQATWKNCLFTGIERLMGALHHELVLESGHDLGEATAKRLGRSRRCIYTGIPFDALDAVKPRADVLLGLGIADDAFVVLMVGRLTEQKDPHTFVDAAAIVRRTHPHAVFLIVGDGDLAESTAERIVDPDGVRMLGRRTDTNDLIAACDAYMLCSRWEGIPLTILTAQYLGKPVVATDKLGLPEVVIDGRTGLLAREGVPASYASAIARLMDEPEFRRRAGEAGRRLVEERHSLAAMVGEFADLFHSRDPNLALESAAPRDARLREPAVGVDRIP